MPSKRWKLSLLLVMTFLYAVMGYTDAAEGMQQPISMGADGWKPIIGSSRPPPSHYQEEIRYYQNPILKETVKAEPLPTTTPTSPILNPKKIQALSKSVNVVHQGFTKGKIPPHSKHVSQYFVLPNHGGHGPHIPLNAVIHGRPSQHGVLKKSTVKNQYSHPNGPGMKKSVMGQMMTAHSTRNEVYVPAPSQGPYTFYSQGKNVRTRESSGLGTVGQKVISIKHPNTHMEFSNHFTPTNHFPKVQHVFIQKQQINEIIPSYNIDMQQNLLPPPIFKNIAEINNAKHNGKLHLTSRIPNDKIIFGHNPLGPNDLILQLPSYEQSFYGFDKHKILTPANVQVTNENIKNEKEVEPNYHAYRKPITDYPKRPTYEVTEGKWEDNTPTPSKNHASDIQILELNFPQFLPTPYKADTAVPTSPTQNEVSTIFGQLSNVIKQYPDTYTQDPYRFDVKEVSTHYPILGKPSFVVPTTESSDGVTGKPTTKSPDQTTTTESVVETIAPRIKSTANHRRRRPIHRQTTTTQHTTTEETENLETTSPQSSWVDPDTERPHRPRRPYKTRPRISSVEDDTPQYNRVRDRQRKRPHHNELRKNHYRKRLRPNRYDSDEEYLMPTEEQSKEEVTDVLPIIQHFTTQGYKYFVNDDAQTSSPTVTERTEKESVETEKSNQGYFGEFKYIKKIEYNHETTTSLYSNEPRDEEFTIPPTYENLKDYEEDKLDNFEKNHDHKKYQQETTSTERLTTNINTDSDEISVSTLTTTPEEPVSTNNEEHLRITTTTPEPTTIVVTTSTAKTVRRRPIKYNASTRPRFSVKDYRQRLNQYSSTSTTSSTTSKSADGVRLRFPTRLRRPIPTASVTTPGTEESTRSKFVPKEPRHGSSHITNEVITEKSVKSVNTRLRPFGRNKSTTENPPVETMKISIRPNLFANRRRPPSIGLRARIQNKNNTKLNDTGNKENEITTEFNRNKEVNSEIDSSSTEENKVVDLAEEDSATSLLSLDIMKNDSFDYSQRVSDLTSSINNDYGRFKTIPSNSRRIPNYYTISTEDPVLPLEAFFSKMNDKEH